ncbi:MAG TPA: phage tail sheath subtilisin-like domain-containing protein [Hyphomicrobium sp.]|nr:phage tail sheath subtilisin-like domain-containing protein [Hyphomicrobium sp.]
MAVDISFHHGTRTFEVNEDVISIRTSQSAVISLHGTAPDADEDTFPIDMPVLIKGASNYSIADKLGATGTLRKALDAIFDQGGDSRLGAYVYVTRHEQGQTSQETLSNIVGDGPTMTGVHAAFKIEGLYGRNLGPRIFIAPGFTQALASDGVSAIAVTAPGTNYGPDTTLTVVGGSGHGAEISPIIVEGAITGVAISKPGWGYQSGQDAPTIQVSNAGAGAGATFEVTIGTVGNPVAHELEGICAQLKAIAFIDGPNTTDDAAVITREKYGTDRFMICDPQVQVYDTDLDAYVPEPSSARFAGVQCRVDRDQGFVKSVSNELIYGIDGVTRPIVYGNQTDYLNENCVSTIVNFGEGYRTWGNRTTANTFLSVRRTRDFVNEAIEKAYLEFVDKPLTEANLKFLVESARAFLRTLEAEGYLLRGSDVWLDEELNAPTELRQGRVTLSIKYEVPPPMEDIRIEAYQNIQAYTLLLQRVGAAIEGGSISLSTSTNIGSSAT